MAESNAKAKSESSDSERFSAINRIRRKRQIDSKKPDIETKNRIDKGLAFRMMLVSIIFDSTAGLFGLLDYLLPPIGSIASVSISATGYGIMMIWFALKKVRLFNSSRKAGNFFVGMIIEAIPYINILPGITFSTFRTIAASRIEDKEKHLGNVSKVKKLYNRAA